MSGITQNGALKRDENDQPVMGGTSSSDNATIINAAFDPVTRRLLTDSAGGGTGTVTSITAGTGLTATPTNPITTTGTIALDSKLAPIDTLGTAGQLIRVNAGATALEYFTSASSGLVIGTTTITSGTNTKVLFDNSGVLGEYTISGTGNVAMTTSPVFTTPTLGVASATTINKLTITAPATGSTLAIADGKTLTVSNTLTFTGTDTSSVAFGAGGTVLYTASTVPLTVGSTTIASGTNTRVLFDNSGVLGEYVISGTGNVAMTTSPTFTTPALGAATATTINGNTFTTGTYTITGQAGKTLTFNGSITLTGTDAQTYTFPTTSKTIAANDGSNWTIASQAIGDLLTATSTTAYGRLAAVAIGQVLVSAGTGTAPAWSASPQVTTIELGAATDTTLARVSGGVISVEGVTIPSVSSTNTLTNKRMTRRLVTVNAPGATPTTNSDNDDIANFTGLSTAITSMTTNLSGTPVDGDLLEFRFTDNGTARGITWGTSFVATTIALPTTTVISTMLRVLFEWDGAHWACVAVA